MALLLGSRAGALFTRFRLYSSPLRAEYAGRLHSALLPRLVTMIGRYRTTGFRLVGSKPIQPAPGRRRPG
jgi:hypothetical protein